MFSILRNRLGIPGVISVIALVFAMMGGAYAANNSGGGKATASAKAKKGPRGPKGAKGDPGPAGPQGPAGANGKDGTNGTNGKDGVDGAPGKGVAVAAEPTGTGNCGGLGGSSIEKEGSGVKTYACNGQSGFTATLPPNETETGTYARSGTGATFIGQSLNVPLGAPIDGDHVLAVPAGETPPAECDDGVAPAPTPANPEADPGYACVFVSLGTTPIGPIDPTLEVETEPGVFVVEPGPGVARTGFVLSVNTTSEGTWAITAP